MNKAELCESIAKKSDLTRSEASKLLDATLLSISEALAEGETVTLIGFGTFTPKSRDERMGRNPKTGESAPIPAHRTASFKLSKGLKEALNS